MLPQQFAEHFYLFNPLFKEISTSLALFKKASTILNKKLKSKIFQLYPLTSTSDF